MNTDKITSFFNLGVSVTLVIYGFEEGQLKVFTQKISKNPYAGAWSFPGKLIKSDESLEDAAYTMLDEAIGNTKPYIEQLNAFGKITRHPLGRVIDVTFYSLINMKSDVKSYRADKESKWVHVPKVPELAYDHNEMLNLAMLRLRRRLINRPIGFKLLPAEFTLGELQALYEEILGHELDKRNFRKKVTKLNILLTKGHETTDNPGRKPRLFSFDPEKYANYMEQGF
ncbi:MAG: NUDIX domain-containing protein [Cryomorphaceae bacterium]|nr:NUDIX hydrolase [Flavobacteriales bacterium]